MFIAWSPTVIASIHGGALEFQKIVPRPIKSASHNRSLFQTQKTTAVRRVAFRETGVSRHPSDDHSTIVLRGLRETLNCPPIMPRDASLSDSRCKIFQSCPGVYYTKYIHRTKYDVQKFSCVHFFYISRAEKRTIFMQNFTLFNFMPQ